MFLPIPPRVRLGLATLIALTGSAAARADGPPEKVPPGNLDRVLANNARAVTAWLAGKGYTNVGVLKFEVQKGGPAGPVSLAAGRLNDSMATRLENALVLATDEKKPVGIVRGAGKVAAGKDPAATFQTAEGRAKLFAPGYPLAWGTGTVAPDAFLVGRVQFDPGMKTATVGLRAFDAKAPGDWQDIPLRGPTVAVTRQILADADEPFTVSADVFRRRGDSEEPLEVAKAADERVVLKTHLSANGGGGRVPEVVPDPAQTPDPKPKNAPKPDPEAEKEWNWVDSLLDFRAYYDGVLVPRTADGNLPPPNPGQKIHFVVKSLAKGGERVGLVVLVNGVNTADHDRTSKEVDAYTKWVLAPNKDYLIRGYYTATKVFPFEAAADAAAAERLSELAPPDKYGQIELHVYREVRGANRGGASELVLREDVEPAESLAELKQSIKTSIATASKPVKKALIVPGEGQDKVLDSDDFDGTLGAKLVITYNPKAKSAPAGK